MLLSLLGTLLGDVAGFARLARGLSDSVYEYARFGIDRRRRTRGLALGIIDGVVEIASDGPGHVDG